MIKKKLAIFASGGGSNAEAIIAHFNNHDSIEVSLIVSNKKDAVVLERAKNHNIDSKVFGKKQFLETDEVVNCLNSYDIDFIILAGFLLLIPRNILESYPSKVINIHPSLLPSYGGKGMYGQHVHQAVFDNNEKKSGMTIHVVNEKFDDGEILFQESVKLESTDTPDVISKKVLSLEHKNYPSIIEKYVLRF